MSTRQTANYVYSASQFVYDNTDCSLAEDGLILHIGGITLFFEDSIEGINKLVDLSNLIDDLLRRDRPKFEQPADSLDGGLADPVSAKQG